MGDLRHRPIFSLKQWFLRRRRHSGDEISALRARNYELEAQLAHLRHVETTLRHSEVTAHHFQEQLKALHSINIELAQIDKLEDFYRRAIELGRDLLGFDRLGLFLLSDDPNQVSGTYGVNPQGRIHSEFDLSFTLADHELIQQSYGSRWNIARRMDCDLWEGNKVVGRGWNVMAMLWNAANPIGWLAADNLIRQEPLHDEQLEILSLYASMLGALILKRQADLDLHINQQRLRLALKAGGMRVWEWRRDTGQLTYDLNMLDGERPWIPDITALSNRVVPEDFERMQALLAHCVREKTAFDMDFRVNLPSGEQRWLASLGHPYHDENGEVAGLIGVSQDVTERKKAEAQAMELALHQERAALLTEFMGNLSHDLKTPLTVIHTCLYLLERLEDPAQRAEKIHTIRAQAALLEDFIQDILTISRLDYTPILDIQPVDWRALLYGVEARLRPAAEHKQLTFIFDLDEVFPVVMGDANELDRMLVNLVENAILYTPEGGAVRVRGQAEEDAVMIEVEDTGIGIEESDVEQIFSRFFRASAARRRHQGGTGLGLAIVKRIVEIHHGQLEVESEVGRGSLFRLRLPVSRAEALV